MTINKSQGQTFEKIGILSRQPVFTHGQLYVAARRVRSFNGLRFYISEYNGQGHLAYSLEYLTKKKTSITFKLKNLMNNGRISTAGRPLVLIK
jgi:hypothetical protein